MSHFLTSMLLIDACDAFEEGCYAFFFSKLLLNSPLIVAEGTCSESNEGGACDLLHRECVLGA